MKIRPAVECVRIDMAGLRFGRLTGIRFVRVDSGGNAVWLFQCECGQEREIAGTTVRKGHSRSCGCLQIERTRTAATTHGMSQSPEFRTWTSLLNRCYNNKNKHFCNYGARGITVCAEWCNSFEQFYRDMGPRPSPEFTIERRDNDKGYAPDNCVWGTRTEQSRNRRSVVLTVALVQEVRQFIDEGKNIAQWARARGIGYWTAYRAAKGITWKGNT